MRIQSKILLTEFVIIAILIAVIWQAGALSRAISILAIFFIAGASFFIPRIVSKPIQDLRVVINSVSNGDSNKRAKIASKDEISELAKDLNVMIENLIEARRLPENILRSMKDGLFVVDTKGNISEVNDSALNILGYAKDELVGKPISAFFAKRPK